jgi:hypothetical protein
VVGITVDSGDAPSEADVDVRSPDFIPTPAEAALIKAWGEGREFDGFAFMAAEIERAAAEAANALTREQDQTRIAALADEPPPGLDRASRELTHPSDAEQALIRDWRNGDRHVAELVKGPNGEKEYAVVRAEVLSALLIGLRQDWPLAPGKVGLVGVDVKGCFDLRGNTQHFNWVQVAQSGAPPRFENFSSGRPLPLMVFNYCLFKDGIDLSNSRIEGFYLRHSLASQLRGYNLYCQTDFNLSYTTLDPSWVKARRALDLRNARISGDLNVSLLGKARVSDSDNRQAVHDSRNDLKPARPQAYRAPLLHDIRDDDAIERFICWGEFNIDEIIVDGSFLADGAHFYMPEETAISAERASFGGAVIFEHGADGRLTSESDHGEADAHCLRVIGAINFAGLRASDVLFKGCCLGGGPDPAVESDDDDTPSNWWARWRGHRPPASAPLCLNLRDAHIRNRLVLSDLRCSEPYSVAHEGGSKTHFYEAQRPYGVFDFRDATVGRLDDNVRTGWPDRIDFDALDRAPSLSKAAFLRQAFADRLKTARNEGKLQERLKGENYALLRLDGFTYENLKISDGDRNRQRRGWAQLIHNARAVGLFNLVFSLTIGLILAVIAGAIELVRSVCRLIWVGINTLIGRRPMLEPPERKLEPQWLADRCDWLAKQMSPNRRSGQFRAQPYEQLAKVLRTKGYGREADEIAIEKRRARRHCRAEGVSSRALSLFMETVARHGYSPLRAVSFMIAYWLIGWWLVRFGLMHGFLDFAPAVPHEAVLRAGAEAAISQHEMVTYPGVSGEFTAWVRTWPAFGPGCAKALEALATWPVLSELLGPITIEHAAEVRGCEAAVPALYALDMMVPFIELGQQSACHLESAEAHGFAGIAQSLRAGYQIFGAILTGITLTTMTGLLRKD